jgi:hypothetical protein
MVVDAAGIPIRVVCDYCRSEHNYRQRSEALAQAQGRGPSERRVTGGTRQAFPMVSDRERIAPPVSVDSNPDLELLLRRIIRETFFHKIVMLRNRLRTLEQHVNASELPDDVKVKLQGYITGCYGSLTSFNVLFADESDQFKGSGGE